MPPTRKGSEDVPGRIYQAAQSGDRLGLLLAMRDRIAMQLDNTQTLPRDLAALSRQLREISEEIDALGSDKAKADPVAQAANTDDEAYE